jgi:hypothetical protein
MSNILSLLPGAYCAYGTYVLLHGSAASAPPAAQIFNPVGVYISLGVFVVLVLTGALLNLIPKRTESKLSPVPQLNEPRGLEPGIPTLSSLLGQPSTITFDPKVFFAKGHYSPLTAEVEQNIKVVAAQNYPADKEGFYARFIGIGLVACIHDETWYTIFGSQLRALHGLNANGNVPISVVRAHYDNVVPKFPYMYPTYTFDRWLQYIVDRRLIVRYQSDIVDITHNGKDFLKYLTHVGRSVDRKTF